jgi:hypothetical protein
MSEYKMMVLHKKGALTSAGIRDLRKAGFVCVAVNSEFSDVQIRMAGGVGFEEEIGDLQVMVLKAAFGSIGFEGRLGELITGTLKAMVKKADADKIRASST